MPNACALNGSADKLGLTDAVGRKAGGKVRVFFLGHAVLDTRLRCGVSYFLRGMGFISFHLSPFSGQICTLLPAQTHKGFSRAESPLLYSFCLFRLPDVLGTRFMPAITDAAFHRMVCDGCYHARTIPDGE